MRSMFKWLTPSSILVGFAMIVAVAQASPTATDVKVAPGITKMVPVVVGLPTPAPPAGQIVGARTPAERPGTEAAGNGATLVTAGGATVSVAEKQQPTAVSSWVSGGVMHAVATTKWKDENPEAWAQRHKQAVGAMKEAFPPDGPPPPATGGLLSAYHYSTWQSRDTGDLFNLRQEVRTALDPGQQLVGSTQGQANQTALHIAAVNALLLEYPAVAP